MTRACPACFRRVTVERCDCGFDVRDVGSGLVLRPGTPLQSDDGSLGYLVGMVLGSGSFGITYLAWDRHAETRVAIKEYLPRELAGRASSGTRVRPHTGNDKAIFQHGLTRFLQEAEALNHFRHPNVVRVLAFFRANDTAYLVMPFYEGATTLGKYLQEKGRMTPNLAVELMIRVLQGLRHVHETTVDGRRWMHRDVKPDNILLRPDAGPVLLDFGAARTELGERSRDVSVVLTAGYAPYEQYFSRGTSQGPWMDVYAAAATLYHAITGDAPVSSLERHEDIAERKPDPLVPPEQTASGVPRSLSHAIRAGLAMKYTERPPDAREFQAMLTAVTFARPSTAGRQASGRAPALELPESASTSPRFFMIALLLVAVLVALVVIVSGESLPDPSAPTDTSHTATGHTPPARRPSVPTL